MLAGMAGVVEKTANTALIVARLANKASVCASLGISEISQLVLIKTSAK